MNIDYQALIKEAFIAQKKAYTPYSHFNVGAALLTCNGDIYQGCNIENAAYSPTNCAERTAFFKAVFDGERKFCAIAIVGGFDNKCEICSPCGVCRQVMMEFCNPKEFLIIMAKSTTEYVVKTLEEMLPMGFGADNLSQ